METHKCYRNGCEVIVPNDKFACRRDWMALSHGIKSRILRSWAILTSRGNRDDPEAKLDARRDWLAAKEEAIAYWDRSNP